MAPQMSPSENNMSSNTICRSSRGADYNKEALHQIRASLQPYAHGKPRERLSPNFNNSACPAQHGVHPSEEEYLRPYGVYSKAPQIFPVEGPKIMRKSSFEKEPLNLPPRGSPALDSNASTRSESPGILYPCNVPIESSGLLQCPTGGRSYAYGCAPEPSPPPPPPRSQGMVGPPPPPTPPRGTTPPPLFSTSSSVAATMVSSVGQRPPLLLSRLSPGPSKTKASSNYVNVSSVSQSNAQRGTSPSSHVCRQPIVVQNCSQVQQQLTQQMQALAIGPNSGPTYSPQGDRPPPYPIVTQMKPATGMKISTPPPSYNAMLQNRQSPTLECRKSPQLTYQAVVVNPHPVPPASGSPTLPIPPVPVVRGGQTARHAKTPTPIIMQSVKSTQVQKPVLQTAVAPASPSVSTPPPSYASSIQQKQVQSVVTSNSSFQESSSAVPLLTATSYSPSPSTPSTPSTPVPTTDPPSYHSTMQAMAAARGFNYMPQPVASIPVQDVPVQELDLSSTPLAHIPISQVPTVNSIITTQPSSQVETVTSCHDLVEGAGQSCSSKFSPITAETASTASRSDSPGSSSLASHDTHAFSQSPVSCLSAITSTPSTQSDMTQESGYSSSPSARGMPPPPPPPVPVEKTMHQSPIPERKNISSELEEQRCESKVKVYSPEAYKFFMEQHVENVIKFHDQRKQRKIQLEKEMKKIGLSTKDQLEIRKMLIQKESNYIRLKRAKMNKLMFQRIKLIGVGAFGEVALVRKKLDPDRLYAMKTLRKADVLKRNQVAHVKAERDILAEADNEWVVKLYYSFQDKDNLYLIMDYIPGGDLMSLLMKFGVFEDSLARFYIGELVCAVESVHKMGFIHRDIKPDNILIDRDGHIKLTDFGLCTGFRWTHNSKYYQIQGEHGRQESIDPCGDNDLVCHCNDLKPLERRRRRQHLRCLAHSLVGTPNYIAPEVLARSGYTQLCDWWSVGVILYEMLVGQPPFMANTPAETQYKVIHWETTLRIPKQADLSPEAKDLILSLCTHPESRLGRNGAQDVKQHPYFGDLNFDAGLRKQMALYIPKINHPTDTSNFDPVDPDRLRPSETNDSEVEWINSSNQPVHGFFEFTFRRFFDSTPGNSGSDCDRDNQHPVYV